MLMSNTIKFCEAYRLAKLQKQIQPSAFTLYSHKFTSENKHVKSKDTTSKLNVQNIILNAILFLPMMNPMISLAGEPLPSLEKCFSAVRKELDPIEGESLKRLSNDIQSNNWNDIKLFTREYDAGFRGYVMKSAWKQIDNEDLKKKGIEISNSFTFDLIALNKASRVKDTDDAIKRLAEVKQDLANFLALESQIKSVN